MAATPIATVDDLKGFMGTTTANTDALLQAILDESFEAIQSYCDRTFIEQAFTEFRDGNDAQGMQLANYPVVSLSAVLVDGRVMPSSVNGLPGVFAPPRGRRAVLVGYAFNRGNRNVVISGVAGYGGAYPWPADLKMAVLMYATTRFKERSRLGIGSIALAGESISYTDSPSGTSSGSKGIPAAAMVILNSYKNTVPETGL